MAVLIEGIAVVVRARPILDRYEGGWEAFVSDCPTDTLCGDGALICVGFMDPKDAKQFASLLTSKGLTHRAEGEAVDFVIADQQDGLAAPCKWAKLKTIPAPGTQSKTVLACHLAGSDNQKLMTPDGWTYDGSLSDRFGHPETDASSEHLEFLRREGNTDVYRNTETGEEVLVRRTEDADDQ